MVLDLLKESREQVGNWYEKDVKDLDMNETNQLISALQDVKKKLVREMSQYSQVNVSQNYFGQSSGVIGGGNVGIDLFDQRRNAFNYNPNMVFPNHTPPMFGYNNDGVLVPISNMNYMSSYNFNQSQSLKLEEHPNQYLRYFGYGYCQDCSCIVRLKFVFSFNLFQLVGFSFYSSFVFLCFWIFLYPE